MLYLGSGPCKMKCNMRPDTEGYGKSVGDGNYYILKKERYALPIDMTAVLGHLLWQFNAVPLAFLCVFVCECECGSNNEIE